MLTKLGILAAIPTHKAAGWMLTQIDNLLDIFGLEHHEALEEAIYVVLIVAIGLALGWLVRYAILKVTQAIVKRYKTDLAKQLLENKVLTKCSHIITPLVIMSLAPFAFESESFILHVLMKILIAYTIIVVTMALVAIATFIWMRFDKRNNTKNLPLKGILNVVNGLLWIIAAIIIVSVLVDKSPAVLLTGLGAFAAALMLIFKDSILGFVAGIQLSENDMLRVGDWIVVPSTIANGIVIDVSLTAVKVQNWDNTIVTLPPYTLVSSSFQNWRGMTDSGWRLISKSFIFDTDSVLPATPEIIGRVKDLPGMSDFLAKAANGSFYDPGVACVNGSTETNLGLFRAYMSGYLVNHPKIAKDQQVLVNILKPSAEGMPLQIYCYTTTAWTAYEAVQSEIIEHAALMCPKFGLRAASADYRDVAFTDVTPRIAEQPGLSSVNQVQSKDEPSKQ